MSRELEEIVLGTALSLKEYRDLVLNATQERYFPNLLYLYKEMQKQYNDGLHFNEETLSANIGKYISKNQLIDLQRLCTPSEDKIKDYIYILRENSDRKRLNNSIHELSIKSKNPETTMDDLMVNITKLHSEMDEATPILALTPSEIFEREKLEPRKDKLITGEPKIDNELFVDAGLHKGDINIILADSGHGKTQFCSLIASKLLIKGYKGLWFQMEDYDVNTAKQMALMSVEYCDNLRIADSIDDIEDMKRQCRVVKQEFGLDFVVIDYIQEVYAQGRYDSRTLEINQVMKVVKSIAKELNCLVLVASQVTINTFNRSGWQFEPRYKDAQWAQVIKNVAHCMTSIFRPNVIEGLLVKNNLGEFGVKGWRENQYFNYNSVFAKVVKSRRGKLTHNRIEMIQNGDLGLEIANSHF